MKTRQKSRRVWRSGTCSGPSAVAIILHCEGKMTGPGWVLSSDFKRRGDVCDLVVFEASAVTHYHINGEDRPIRDEVDVDLVDRLLRS